MGAISGAGIYYKIVSGDTLSKIAAKNPDLGYKNWKELLANNLDEIMRVGREKMAAIGVAANVTRKPCRTQGHSDTLPHFIKDGVHYDGKLEGIETPTIYPDTVIWLKKKGAPPPPAPPAPPPKPKPKPAPPPDPPVIEDPGRDFGKDFWTGVEHQAPGPILEVFFRGDPNTPDIRYTADLKAGDYSKLLSYNFMESVDSLEGSFSFTVENEEIDRDGKTVFDIIPLRAVIKIYEGASYPAFVGIIRRRHNSVSMTGQGVKRTITFSGKSIISVIVDYTVSLDVRIQGVADAMAKTKKLEDQLARDGLTIKAFMKETWDYFREVSETAGISTTGLADVIDKFIGTSDNFLKVTGREQKLRYNVAMVFFNASTNSIGNIWRHILPAPVYELFSRCDEGKPKVIARQVPYGNPDDGNTDWKSLDRYLIAPISLISYELEQSDEEVYTAFAGYIIGSAMSKEFYMAVNQTGNDSTVAYDTEKQKIYGYKPLEITFNGYDRQGNAGNGKIDSLTAAIKKLNKTAAYWYSRLEEMYSGSITICTDFIKPETNPRVGCRAKFIGGEFYITRTDHTWNYGGTPTIKLTLSRGMMYDENGKMRSGADGVIKNVGRRFRELER